MILDDLYDLLTSQGVATTDELYKGFMPEQPDSLMAVYETGGLPPVRRMTPTAGDVVVQRPSVQVVARGLPYDYAAVRLKVNNAYLILEGLADRTINGVRYLYAAAAQEPFPMGRDDLGRVRVAVNVDLVKERSTA